MSSLFVARLGEPEREILARALAITPYGMVVSYGELGQLLERDPEDERRAIQAAVRRTIELLERGHSRTLEAVPTVGYRVVAPEEHVRVSDGYLRKSHRSLRRGMSVVRAAPVALLGAADRMALEDRVERLERVNGAMVAWASRTEERVSAHERRLAALEKRHQQQGDS
jgi:hypothetical protein